MECKRCGEPENRIHGFCSIRCEELFELEIEVQRLREERRWKSVERDGLPEPDGDKQYNVLYWCGSGTGSYRQDYEDKSKNRWYCDFDTVGHEEEITDYLEIHYPDEPPEVP